MNVSVKRATNIHDIVDVAIAAFADYLERPWWRGEDAEYETRLVPDVWRRGDRGPGYEHNILTSFQLRAGTRHNDVPKVDDLPAWLFLAQHYRLPTRLLDWTESVFTACWFAVRGSQANPGIIWALAPAQLNHCQGVSKALMTPTAQELQRVFSAAFDGTQGAERVFAVLPQELDARMMHQQSTFTVHESASPIDMNPDAPRFLTKVVIPGEYKLGIAKALNIVGVRESLIFPDLEGLARDVSGKRFTPPATDL